MTDEQVVAITRLAREVGLAGIIATNTTVSRDGLLTDAATVEAAGPGGLSGPPLAARSLAVLKAIRAEVADPAFCVISVGGVATSDDVRERLAAGATLVQGYTAFIYEGPSWPLRINRDLSRHR